MALDRLRSGIFETARALGMNPLDLATIISYETGGTFSPTQPGPTTKWGRHRGLIQFGEPQARKYGVDWSDPLGSQLGPQGAIAKYFRAAGYKPGMGLLDAYAAVNAGEVGRYDVSDAAAGGAPGTVRDKVENQMGGHRRQAESLLMSDPAIAEFVTNNPQPGGTADAPQGFGQTVENAIFGGGSNDTLIGGTGAGNAPFSIPQDVADYASDKPSTMGRIGSFLEVLGQAAPPPPRPPSGGGFGDARATGDALANVLNSPTIADALFKRRMAGLLG